MSSSQKPTRGGAVVVQDVQLPAGYNLQSLAVELADQLYKKVMKTGMHPGHCAVVFDQGASNQLFPPPDGGLPAFVQLVNSSLNGMTANKKAGCMLQMSQDMGETLLYQKNASSSLIRLVGERSPSGSIAPVEETALSQTERHAEVFTDINCSSNQSKTVFSRI